ncbi:MAG: FKBP-type peptidyl-prolyl cis-trans isomerase, partial [Clostridia bacterium]|nr:FKBP-type peptidyl-prolyl cis-trans isomerase [Clostridia bacterium]
DEEYLKAYIADYRKGKTVGEKRFQYEDLLAYIDLAPYKGMLYPDDDVLHTEISDEELESYLTQIFLAAEVSDDQYTTLTEGVVQKYDMITLDYRGVIDGKEVENATAKDQSLLVGSGKFISGFEEGLLEKKIGEEVVLNLKFSPYYSDKDVAGKDITFYVTAKQIQRPTIPEFNVEVINKNYQTSFKTMEEAREYFRGYMKENAERNAYSALCSYLQAALVQNSTVKSYPEKELEIYKKHYSDYYAQYKEEGVEWEDFCQEQMGISYDEFKALSEEYAKDSVATNLVIRSIAKQENITFTDEQMSALILGIYEDEAEYYLSLEDMISDYATIYGADYFEYQLLSAQVLDLLQENAVKEAA